MSGAYAYTGMGHEIDLNKLSFLVQQTLETEIGDVAGAPRAIMFSGGFDSMLIASLAQYCGAKVTAVTIQFDDFNPLTVAGAVEFAERMKIKHHIIPVKAVEFLSAFEELAGLTDEPVLDLDLAVVCAALKKYDHLIAGDTFISGMGSDQWFGNVALKNKPENLALRLDKAMVDGDAHQRVAQAHGCKFVFPFLSVPMLALSSSIPAAMKKDKKLLRELAVAHALPSQASRSEVQVPALMRHILVKTYGDRAWPEPVLAPSRPSRVDERTLRQITVGLWLEKAKAGR